MENKLAIASLAIRLAQATGKSKKLCEDFLKEFFRLASENLVEGEPLKIKGFGTFKITEVESRLSVNVNTGQPHEIASHKKVVFTPSKELAATINAPFEEFESVEIEDDMPENFLDQDFLPPLEKVNVENQTVENGTPKEEIKEDYQKSILEDAGFNKKEEEVVSIPVLEAGSEEEAEDDEITYEAYNETKEDETIQPLNPVALMSDKQLHDISVEETKKTRFGIGFLFGALVSLLVCVVIFMLGCFFDWWPVNFRSSKEVEEIPIINNKEYQTAQEEERVPEEFISEESLPIVSSETINEPKKIYDTVSTTRYLTTIAREHYGNFNFWPYIYIENESILGHPDRITPGTQVVVPDLSKYGVNPSSKEDVALAKKKAQEIYSRFK